MEKTYSVLMSVYQKENPKWLDVSMESMFAQTLPLHDFVLVEDGILTKELYDVIDEKRTKYGEKLNIVKLEKNSGLGIALSEGLKECQCDIVLRMDSDDYSMSERAERQLKVFDEGDFDIVGSFVGEFEDDPDAFRKIKKVPEKNDDIVKYSRRRNPFNHPSVAFKKESVIKAGNYQPFLWIEDYDLWLRMLSEGMTGYNIPDCLLRMRVNGDAYKRRGGITYLSAMLKFNRKWRKAGWYSQRDYIVRSTANMISSILPNGFRNVFYKIFLRK